MTILTIENQTNNGKADWLLVFEAALRVGNISSFDGLIQLALAAWLVQLLPELRWRIAIELYTNEQISGNRRFASVIQNRLSKLSADALHLAMLAAVVGHSFSLEVAQALAEARSH